MADSTRIVFIHGTFCGCEFTGFQDDCKSDGGFISLRPFILNKQAKLFYWARIEKKYNFLQSCNPFVLSGIFRSELDYIQTREAVYNLHVFLENEQPDIVVAHSLGCHYLLNMINEYSLPKSVTSIYTLLSEFPYKKQLVDVNTLENLKNNELSWDNYHCFYDPTLISSMFISGQIPAGLRKWRQPFVKNHLYFEIPSGNPHTHILRNRKFVNKFKQSRNNLNVRMGQMVNNKKAQPRIK